LLNVKNNFLNCSSQLSNYEKLRHLSKYILKIVLILDLKKKDIDIRAETLINIIHDSRDSLVADIKNHRDETNLK